MSSPLRRQIANSRLAPIAAFPLRIRAVARHNGRTFADSARWLVTSREHTNFTYDLTTLNRVHLAWWVANLTLSPVEVIRAFMDEVENDDDLKHHVLDATRFSARRHLADPDMRLSKRVGWYALIRALRPGHVVETGTDKGLGSVVLAAALLRNGAGKLTTIDVNRDSGYLIGGRYAAVTDRVIGDSLTALRSLTEPVDLFLHDSLHTYAHEAAEYDAVADRLSSSAVVLSDNAHVTDALPTFAEGSGRRFTYWQERPAQHWYPGAGIGAAYARSTPA